MEKEFVVKIKVKAEDAAKVKKIGALLQNIASKVDNASKLELFEKIKSNPDFFKTIVQKLNNPVISKFFK